jgi:arginyl-tRNA synthetase
MIKSRLEKILGFELEATENPDFGDYSSNVALAMFSKSEIRSPKSETRFKIPNSKFENSRELAETIVKQLKINKELSEYVDKIDVAGPGFINFWLKKDVLADELQKIHKEGDRYGWSSIFGGQKIVFEYAHPNTHKAFHIGHLRNITTGETLARLFEANGAEIVRVNYQGDVGLHIAKALWGINKLGFTDPKDIHKRVDFLSDAYTKGAKAYEEDEKAKEEINIINNKIYDNSDEKLMDLYRETRKWSLDYFSEIYKRVYTKFDRLYFESEVFESGKEIAEKALKSGILEKSEGAVIFPGSKHGLHDRVFISSKGVPTYEAKDLGLAKLQFSEYNPDKLIHTVGPEQIAYFQVLFKALELILPDIGDREIHIPYGWVRLKKGKMSSRTGNVVLGEWLLDEAKKSIKKLFETEERVAEQIAVGAVKYSFLRTGLNQDIAFDLKESISLEGNSGPYLQYTVARTNSVLTRMHLNGTPLERYLSKGESLQVWANNLNNEELSVLRVLVHFSEVIESAAKNYSPNLLCNYIYDLAQKYNGFYNKHKIIGSENEEFRLVLTGATGQVLKNGLKLLGIETPERM